MIDIMGLQQAYEQRLITDIKWINGNSNPADAMTKGKPCEAVSQLIDTNKVELQTVGWVDHVDLGKDLGEN